MKKIILSIGLVLIAGITLQAQTLNTDLVTNQSQTIVQTLTATNLSNLISQVQAFGVSNTVPLTTNNFGTCIIVVSRTNQSTWLCYIRPKPVALLTTNTSVAGVQLISRTVVIARVPVLPLSSAQVGELETTALGDLSDLGLTVAPSNTASIFIAPQTNGGSWSATLRLK